MNRPIRRLRALPLVIALLTVAGASVGQIYKWTDQGGTVHFTDNLQNVPPQYQDQLGTLDDRLPPPPAVQEVPLERAGLGYLVNARVDGTLPVRLLLDTGATATVLSSRVAQSLGLPVHDDPPVVVQTANGTVQAGWARVREIEVGGKRVGPLQVVIHDAIPGADGLLGMNFLSAFRVEIRSAGPTLVLSPY